ncbi:MAG: hypothetical protein AAGG46_06720 [Planctomycetota bacterium]
MTPGQRLTLSLAMLESNWPWLMRGSKEEVDRRFELINRTNDERNEALLAGMAHLRKTR